jgi:class III poly(R)-hydroxyalkanoic acid synthase PhaE subunit
MSEKNEAAAEAGEPALQWAKLWQTMAESSDRMAQSWSSSMVPFMMDRMSEKPMGFGDGNELSEAIERMSQGPRLADAWDIDKKLALAFRAWIDMRQRLAAYNAIASAPWSNASKRFFEAISETKDSDTSQQNWRKAFALWSEISNEELIRNQRSSDFLQVQKELLQAGLQLRSRQDDLTESLSEMFGLPTRREFDEVTRQLTELRRELRALSRQMRADKEPKDEMHHGKAQTVPAPDRPSDDRTAQDRAPRDQLGEPPRSLRKSDLKRSEKPPKSVEPRSSKTSGNKTSANKTSAKRKKKARHE